MSRMSQCTVGGGRVTASSSVYSGTHCSSSELAVACRHTNCDNHFKYCLRTWVTRPGMVPGAALLSKCA